MLILRRTRERSLMCFHTIFMFKSTDHPKILTITTLVQILNQFEMKITCKIRRKTLIQLKTQSRPRLFEIPTQIILLIWNLNQNFNNFQNFDDLNLQLHDNSAELEEDFRNLERLESTQHDRTNSLNLGSVYSKNEYQFDDKVSSVQRDLSIYNYSEEFDADDLSSSENNDKITQLGQYQQNGLMRDRTYGKLSQPCSSRGMLRIKSSTKLFTLDNPKNETSQNSSDSFSNLSTGDSAYPVESFKQRAIKEFRPKISICNMNRECLEPKNTPFEVPRTKRTYGPPIGSKVVYSPPNQEENKNMNIYKRARPKPTTYHQSKNSAISDCSENITADEGFAITFPEKVAVQKSRINYMPVNKPFNRKEYTQPQSMLTPANRYSYLHIRRNRPGFCSRIS